MVEEYVPEVDTSYGLIYRLNYLWGRVDREALNGRFDKWEIVLDRIFSNLLYREEVETEENGKEEIVDVKLSEKDIEIWQKLKEKIRIAKSKRLLAIRNKNSVDLMKSKGKHYKALMVYDIWLRKFMHQSLKLYMKESESNPSKALFGNAYKNKKRR